MIQRLKARIFRARLSPITLGSFMVLWCLMWGDFALGNLVNGVLIGVVVSVVFPMPHMSREAAFRPLPVLWLLLVFVKDLFVASMQVSWQVLRPRPVQTSGLVRVKLRAKSDLLLTITTDLYSLIPGSLIIEVERDTAVVHVHALGVSTPEGFTVVREQLLQQEERVLRAFAPQRELEALGLVAPRQKRQSGPGNEMSVYPPSKESI